MWWQYSVEKLLNRMSNVLFVLVIWNLLTSTVLTVLIILLIYKGVLR